LKDYLADLKARGKTGRKDKNLKLTGSRLKRLFKECSWAFPVHVSADSCVTWRSRQSSPSPSSMNHFLNTANTFLRWMERNQRITHNPLKHVVKVVEKKSQKIIKRAFKDEELASILAVAPEYRHIVYLTAAFTGLRFQELQMLEWGDVIFDGENSRLEVRDSTTKNDKEAVIPLVPILEQALSDYRPENEARGDRVFKQGVPTLSDFEN
jgi:integrase